MKLCELTSDAVASDWTEKGYELPKYNRENVKEATKKAPTWVHFGAGNIFRAFPAARLQEILNDGCYDKGVIVAESFDHQIIEKAYKPYDGMSLSVVLKADGTIEKIVVGSVVESLVADPVQPEDYKRLQNIFMEDSLQMVSFTITEKGYSVKNAAGEIFDFVKQGFVDGPQKPQGHLMGRIAALCYQRFEKNAKPIALVSMDNCSHNGDKLKDGVMAFVSAWAANGLVPAQFVEYMQNEKSVSFPWSMIDKITPRPDENVVQMLKKDGFEDTELIITDKNTYTAPFVNSEETGYLVIEDSFPNGRPPLEKAGIVFTERETVDKVEKMKVCTCLNPLHTALAIYGCMLGYTKIYEEMRDTELSKLITDMCYIEGMPVVVNPSVINPKEFANTVLTKRLPNPFMPDAPQRIATDTSQKLPIRFGETIKAYLASDTLDVNYLVRIPLVLAGWCRYLVGIDDEGNAFEQSSDPRLETVSKELKQITLGSSFDTHALLQPILSDETIFAVDLYEAGIAKTIEGMFDELMAGPGAIRNTLKKYVG